MMTVTVLPSFSWSAAADLPRRSIHNPWRLILMTLCGLLWRHLAVVVMRVRLLDYHGVAPCQAADADMIRQICRQ
jgi:hypothetical protein